MSRQPRFSYYDASDFFEDGAAARQPVAGTVARGQLGIDPRLISGIDAQGVLANEPLIEVTLPLLAKGQQQFNIYCSVCHGEDGYGEGMIVRRGFPAPPSFHTDRLREVPLGYFIHVIDQGYGLMYPYASRVSPENRWAIAAYIRALQLSQHADTSRFAPGMLRSPLQAVEEAPIP